MSIWIKDTPISIKKVLFLTTFLLALNAGVFLSGHKNLFHFSLISSSSFFLSTFLFLAYLAYKSGIYILHHTFTISTNIYQVRDFIHLKNWKESYREIYPAGSLAISSRIYLYQQKNWAYFDVIRTVLEKQKRIRKVLILGGGGGSVAKTISNQFPDIEIYIIEINKEMIDVSQKFFLHKEKNITLIHGDAFQFIGKTKEKFDFVFLDIFDGGSVCIEITKPATIAKLFQISKIVLVNFGFNYKEIPKYTKQYLKISKNFKLYLAGSNIIGCNVSIPHCMLGFPGLFKISTNE